MARRFRPLEDSIKICETMITRAMNVYEYDPDPDEIEYWTKRLHGYQKLQRAYGKQTNLPVGTKHEN